MCVFSPQPYISLGLVHVIQAPRYLATLTQGKFGRLKINVVFAENDLKLNKNKKQLRDHAGEQR